MNPEEMTTREMADAGICPKCRKTGQNVYERYSFGIYAGIFCDGCCSSYRDNCGLDQPQGSAQEMIEAGEDYYGDDW